MDVCHPRPPFRGPILLRTPGQSLVSGHPKENGWARRRWVCGGARTDILAGGQRVQPSGSHSENAPETFSQSPPVSTRSTYAGPKGGGRKRGTPVVGRVRAGAGETCRGGKQLGRLRGGRWYEENALYFYRTYVRTQTCRRQQRGRWRTTACASACVHASGEADGES